MCASFSCTSIVLTVLVVRMSGAGLSDQGALLVLNLKKHFRAHCVSVVNTEHNALKNYMLNARKKLSSLNIDVSYLNGNVVSLNSSLQRCRLNRPLYVIFFSENTKAFLNRLIKIPSYPRWLLFLNTATSVRELMNQVYIPFDCEFFLVEEKGAVIDLKEVYKVSSSAHITEVHFGTWNKNKGLQATKLSLYNRRNDLQGVTLKVAIAQSFPFNIFRGGSIAQGNVDGFLGKLWKIIEKLLNFKTEYVTPVDGAWGSRLPNGSWNGMVGMVSGKEAQISASEFTMMESRVGEVDFLLPFAFSSFSILIRQPEGLTLKWTDLAAPLASGMWAATVAFILSAAVALLVASRVWMMYGTNTTDPRETNYNLSDAFLQVFGPFCNQGSATVLLSLSSRAVFLMACITSLVVVAAYSASLISILTVQKTELPFDSLQGFANDGTYRLGMMDKSSALTFFQNTTNPLFNEIYQKSVLPELGRLTLDDTVGMRRLCTETKFAFATTSLYASNFVRTLPCAVIWIPEAILRDTLCFIIEKESAYRGIFDHNLRRLRDTGVMEKLRRDAWPNDADNLHQSFTEIGFHDVIPVLALLGCGFCLGVIALIIELNIARLGKLTLLWWARMRGLVPPALDKKYTPKVAPQQPCGW